MPTNLLVDDTLLNEAMRLSGLNTKRAAVNAALREYIERRAQANSRKKRLAVLKSLGTFDFDPSYDYKRERRRR